MTSTAWRRVGEYGAQEMVGFSTTGRSNPASAAGTSSTRSIRTVFGCSMPKLRATDKVRSLSFATPRAASDGKASRHPSDASWWRCGTSAAMEPSLAGRITRVGQFPTKSTTASPNALRSVAKLGRTTFRAEYREQKARTGRVGSHSAKHSPSATRSPARPRLRTVARLCRIAASSTRMSYPADGERCPEMGDVALLATDLSHSAMDHLALLPGVPAPVAPSGAVIT